MKLQITDDPLPVSLLGALRAMEETHDFMDLIAQTRLGIGRELGALALSPLAGRLAR